MKNKSVILLVDDQPQNNELLEALLAPQGYEVVKASCGREALEKISSDKIDLVLLDIMMPEMSGIEVLVKMRASEMAKATPVVMVTALKETEDKIKALEAGCDDFISKPVDKVELLARVKSLLKASYYLRQIDEKEKFNTVVDKISDGIAVCSPDYLIKDCNAALLKYLNIGATANVNLVDTLFKDYSVSMSKEGLIDLTLTHKTFDIVRKQSEASEALYLETNLDAIKNDDGDVLSIVFILRDVTAARKEELFKQDSLALMSHNLSAPLGVINGNISLLQAGSYGTLNEEQKKAVDAVAKQSALIISTVEKMLGFTIVCGH